MDTVVYPDPEVDAALRAELCGLKINLLEKHPDFKEASLGHPVPWAPTFLFTDAKGHEVRRSVGWLGKEDFLAEVKLAQGLHHLGRWRFDEAIAVLEEIDAERSGTDAAPEAAYYAGVALFIKGKRDMQALADRWTRLRNDHPESNWSKKASVITDL